ncbi:MAG TPA: nucleotide exchange factor GrpE [Candidatus Coprenecus stercoripullorum]|nr:nucleotide exchange factor GrpE [Candidatus Coprenecus stercoripullorum]
MENVMKKAEEEKKNKNKKEDRQATGEKAAGTSAEKKTAVEEDPSAVCGKELEEAKDRLAEANDKYLRLAAEFDNFRRRTARERLELVNTAGEDIFKGLLPVIDDCERALQVLEQSDAGDAAKEGTRLIYNKLMSFLKGRGVVVIDAMGKELDTDYHEAVAQIPVQEDDRKNRIVDVVQQGYMLHDKVIRFAKVVVGV